MEAIRRTWRRFKLLARRGAIEAAMDDEMRQHIELQTAELVASGLPAEEARRQATRAFGNVELLKDQARDGRGTGPVEDIVRDVRYAVRVLRRNPGFTLAAGLTLTLGIGATTAIVSVVYGVVLRPLPYEAPERLVAVWERHVPRNRDQNVVSLENFEAWRDRATSFSGMAALVPRPVTLAGDGSPERLPGAEVSAGYFTLLGIPPAMGRDFTPSDTTAVILSDGFWKRRFGSDPSVVGRTLTISGAAHTIVGVMPSGFAPPEFGWLGQQDLWFPLLPTAQARSWGRFLLVVARLEAGVRLDRADAELRAIAAVREEESPSNRGWSAHVVSLKEQITGDARVPLLALLAGVIILLALAVVNVGALTASLMRRRSQELSIRRALGASDRRLFRQLFVQSAVVGASGAALGLLAAVPGLRLLTALLPADVPRSSSIALDLPVLLIAVAVSALATIMFGTTAAVRGRSPGPFATAVPGNRVTSRAGGGVLIATEIALGLALAVIAVLMLRSFDTLRRVDLGFDAGDVLVARLGLSERYDSPERKRAVFDALVERLRETPAVASAGIVSSRPFSGLGPATFAYDARGPKPAPADLLTADARYADSGFFTTLRIPLLAGRTFDADSPDAAAPSVIVNQALARALWPGGQVVGRRLTIGLFNNITAEVIGVVGDIHLMDARTPPRATIFLSAARFPSDTRDVLVRATGDPAQAINDLRAALAAMDPALPLYLVTPLSRVVDESLAEDRFTAFLLAAFAGCALMLASIGIAAVFAGDAAARRREIAVRLALGARGSSVALMILRRSLVRAAAGVLIGSGLALALVRPMATLLFGVSPGDPVTFGAVSAGVLLLACLATLLPTCRALRRSPLAALREG